MSQEEPEKKDVPDDEPGQDYDASDEENEERRERKDD